MDKSTPTNRSGMQGAVRGDMANSRPRSASPTVVKGAKVAPTAESEKQVGQQKDGAK
jgi:hypothetical protein